MPTLPTHIVPVLALSLGVGTSRHCKGAVEGEGRPRKGRAGQMRGKGWGTSNLAHHNHDTHATTHHCHTVTPLPHHHTGIYGMSLPHLLSHTLKVVHVEVQQGRPAAYAVPRAPLAPPVLRALAWLGITPGAEAGEGCSGGGSSSNGGSSSSNGGSSSSNGGGVRLYRHQAMAVDAVLGYGRRRRPAGGSGGGSGAGGGAAGGNAGAGGGGGDDAGAEAAVRGRGQHVVVCTATASGKSLCYLLPLLQVRRRGQGGRGRRGEGQGGMQEAAVPHSSQLGHFRSLSCPPSHPLARPPCPALLVPPSLLPPPSPPPPRLCLRTRTRVRCSCSQPRHWRRTSCGC